MKWCYNMKTQYRITQKNSRYGWLYTIQRKFLCFWFDTLDQQFYPTSLRDCQDKLNDIIQRKKEFQERKKAGNSVIIKS